MGSGHCLAVLVLLGVPVATVQGPELAVGTGLSLWHLLARLLLSPGGHWGSVGCLGHPCAHTLSPREPWGLAEPNEIPK